MNLETFNHKEIEKIINLAVNKAHVRGLEDVQDAKQQAFLEYLSSEKLQGLLTNEKDALCDKLRGILVEWYKPLKEFRDKMMVDPEDATSIEDVSNHQRRLDSGEMSIGGNKSGTEFGEV